MTDQNPELPTLATIVGLEVVGPPPDPEQTPENFVCMRGPCKHLWSVVTDAQEGNPEGTFDRPIRMRVLTCERSAQEMDLSGRLMWQCSRWNPGILGRIRLAFGGGR